MCLADSTDLSGNRWLEQAPTCLLQMLKSPKPSWFLQAEMGQKPTYRRWKKRCCKEAVIWRWGKFGNFCWSHYSCIRARISMCPGCNNPWRLVLRMAAEQGSKKCNKNWWEWWQMKWEKRNSFGLNWKSEGLSAWNIIWSWMALLKRTYLKWKLWNFLVKYIILNSWHYVKQNKQSGLDKIAWVDFVFVG